MYNIIIWGSGIRYNQYFNLIKYFEMKGEISVRGIISNDKNIGTRLDGYKVYPKSQIRNVEFDYCLVTMKDVKAIFGEAEMLGISKQKIIPIQVLSIPYFNFKNYIYLKEEGISILSRTCWGGVCYHYLMLQFQSPTINMFFSPLDFNKFVANLDYYLSLPLEFVEMKYKLESKCTYPVGALDDILLYFNHYTSFEEAECTWTRRKKRMNKNIVVISSATDKDAILKFTELPFKNKLIFIPKDLNIKHESCYPIDYSDGTDIGTYSNKTADGRLSLIDVLSLLCQMNYNRIN